MSPETDEPFGLNATSLTTALLVNSFLSVHVMTHFWVSWSHLGVASRLDGWALAGAANTVAAATPTSSAPVSVISRRYEGAKNRKAVLQTGVCGPVAAPVGVATTPGALRNAREHMGSAVRAKAQFRTLSISMVMVCR